jgi:predicted N-acyltransferase
MIFSEKGRTAPFLRKNHPWILQPLENLHSDTCDYAPIEWAIEHGVQIFELGVGDRHKKRRGFPDTPNYSLHRFYDERLMHILRGYIYQINEQEQMEIDAINADLPLKQKG